MRVVAPFCLAVAATISVAHAGEPQRARLVYAVDLSAGPGCPDATAFRKAVADRLGYDPFWEWAPRTIMVQVHRDQVRYAARVVNVDAAGRSASRELPPDEDCAEVTAAAALAISIVLDAESSTPSPIAAPPVPSASPAASSAPEPEAVPERPAPPPIFARAIPPAPRFAIGGDVAAVAGIAPRPGLSVAGFVELRRRHASIGGELRVAVTSPTEQLQALLGSADIAPCVRFGPMFACGLGEVGWLQAWSAGLGNGNSDASPFVALGGRAGVEVAISEQTFVHLQSDLLVEIYGPRFEIPELGYDASGVVYRARQAPINSSIVGGALSVGLGVYLR